MNAPVSTRDLLARVVLAKQTMDESRDCDWTMAMAAHADASEAFRQHVAAALQLELDDLPDVGALI